MEGLSGADRIAAERTRQIEVEDWDPAHDEQHGDGELVWAAICYAAPKAVYRCEVEDDEVEDDSNPGPAVRFYDPWPWHESDRNPGKDRIRQLEKAGALIAAEIDRLLRDRALRDRS